METVNRDFYRGITIDGPTTKDMDDAIHVRRDGAGWKIRISISDVASAVPLGCPLDQDAFSRAFTVYRRDWSKPMLPRGLSERGLSLVKDKVRKAITYSFRLNDQLEVEGFRPTRSVVRVNRRMTYDDVHRVLADDLHPDYKHWRMLADLSGSLLERRRAKGALVIYDITKGLVADEEGVIRKFNLRDTSAHIIVQEMMILANTEATRWLAAQRVPFLYRNHAANSADAREQYLASVARLLVDVTPEELEQITHELRTHVGAAKYAPTCEGHFGLSLDMYAHWTSPIRRYVDVVNQRILHAVLDGKPSPYTLAQLETIAEHLNVRSAEDRLSSSEFFSSRIAGQLGQSTGESIAKLDRERFSQFIRYVSKRAITPTDAQSSAVLKRLKAEIASAKPLASILFGPPWPGSHSQEILAAAAEQLLFQPELAVNILAIAEGKWEGPSPHTIRFVSVIASAAQTTLEAAITVNETERTSGPVTRSNRQLCERDSIAALTLRLSGLDEFAKRARVTQL